MTSFFWNGCDLFDQEEPIPSYLYIDNMVLDTNPLIQGSGQHDIKDAWVSVNNQFIGIYPLPAIVPVLETGIQEVRILPGVAMSGLSDFRVTYPLYTFYEKEVELEAGAIDTVLPTVAYDDDAIFLLVEDFETANSMGHDVDDNIETKIVRRPTDVFEGLRSGEIEFTTANPFVEIGSTLLFQIPDPEYVYLEVNYKTDVDIEFGVMSYQNNDPYETIYVTGVFPSDEWRKIYIDITNNVKAMTSSGGEEFRLIIRGINIGDETAYAYLDNIKLIYQ